MFCVVPLTCVYTAHLCNNLSIFNFHSSNALINLWYVFTWKGQHNQTALTVDIRDSWKTISPVQTKQVWENIAVIQTKKKFLIIGRYRKIDNYHFLAITDAMFKDRSIAEGKIQVTKSMCKNIFAYILATGQANHCKS